MFSGGFFGAAALLHHIFDNDFVLGKVFFVFVDVNFEGLFGLLGVHLKDFIGKGDGFTRGEGGLFGVLGFGVKFEF